MPKISVIVPVYKVEAFLQDCVDSILNQTFKDFECILVNDGSSDACPALCDNYAKQDSRVRVIHQENGGVSSARNTGIRCAQGEWITFVDSDDTLKTNFLEKLYAEALLNKADMVCCSYFTDPQFLEEGRKEGRSFCTGKLALLKHWQSGNFDFIVWCKLYRTDIIKNHFFPTSLRHEDEYYNNHTLELFNNIVILPDKLYFYRQQTTSFMNTSYSEKRLDIFTVTFDAFQHFSSRGFQELLPHVARQFWRRFYKYSRKAVKANCLTPLREQELLTACLTIKKAGFSPRKPLTALLAALFMHDRTRPLFYRFCGRKKASPK